MLTSDFDFDLPDDCIALRPAEPRDSARLLVVRDGGLEDRIIRDLPDFLQPGDALVFNDTRVIPARLSGVLLCLAGLGGWRIMLRDARHHASPNGGWPEAAMAGVLGRRLGGPVSYDGEPAPRAWLGDGPAPDAADLNRALWVYRRACLLLWIGVGGLAWLV